MSKKYIALLVLVIAVFSVFYWKLNSFKLPISGTTKDKVETIQKIVVTCVNGYLHDSGVVALNSKWALKDGYVYVIGYKPEEKIYCIEGADASTFTPLDKVFLSDRNHYVDSQYAKDSKYIYEAVSPYDDDRSVKILKEADQNSFVQINSSFAKDSRHVFFEGVYGTVTTLLDAATFKLSSNGYFAEDATSVYGVSCYEGCQLLDLKLNPSTFKVFNEMYVRDKDRVICYGKDETGHASYKPIAGADVATFISSSTISRGFENVGAFDASDKNRKYKNCRPV